MTRKSTGVSIHHNFDSLVLARRSFSSTRAAAGAFHRRIFAWTARSFGRLFTTTRILTGTGLWEEKIFAIVNRLLSRKRMSGPILSRGNCTIQLTTRFTFAKGKGTT